MLDLIAERHALPALEQLEPILLLLFRRHRQIAHSLIVDLLGPVSVLSLREQVSESEALLDHQIGHAEGGGDLAEFADVRLIFDTARRQAPERT